MRVLFYAILLILLNLHELHASHAAGMDISYECISQGTNSDTYRVTVKFYRDCSGNVGADYDGYITYSSSCGSGSAFLTQIGPPIILNPECASFCNGGSSLGIEEYTYQGTITLSHCSDWSIYACEYARNAAINTIVNPGGQDLCIEATLNNTMHCNNSPSFSQYPTPFICAGSYYCYNNGAIEIDGDSLVYSLITPYNSTTGNTVTYIAPYSSNNPVGGGSSFDPVTGNLCVTPPSIISGILAIKVEEYRNGILIGSIIRDIQINVFNCTATNPPSLSAIDDTNIVDINTTNTYTVELDCPDGSQNISFDINTINNNPTPPPAPPGYNITVNINTASWANEISWNITSAGVIVASGGNYNNYNTYTTTVCVPSGPLVFNMYDSWGDGWNGATYSITGNNTLTGVTTGGLAFGSFGSNTFSISGGNPCVLPGSGSAFVNMSWNNGIPGASFTITNNNSMNPIGTFSWTPTILDTANSPYFFTVDVTNDACPSPGNFSFQYQIILNGSDINISPIITDPTCNGLSNGSIITTSTGSNNPFSYSWSHGPTTQNINNLAAGNYTLTVTDTNGCSTNATYTLANPPPFNPAIVTNNISCNGLADGSISVINEPNSTSYLWSNGATTSSINNLSPGNYSVNIISIDSCILTSFFNITEPPAITINNTVNNISCDGDTNGSVQIIINGGVPDYTVNFPPYNQQLVNGINSFSTPSVLSTGTYYYSVTDSNGCIVSDSINLTSPSPITVNPIITNVLCKDESNGSIILNTSGGTSPYNEDFGGTINPLSLSAGTYPFTITDLNGCTFSDNIIISEPDSLLATSSTTDATCGGYSDGTASLIINGGTLPYLTDWGLSNPNALNAGTHTYIVTDNNNCIAQGSILINEPPSMQIIINTTSTSCFGGTDGSASLIISGGAGAPYIENWGGLNQNALPAGLHVFSVTDINNCIAYDTALINQPTDFQVNELLSHVSCYGLSDGNAFVQVNGGNPPYTQNWYGVDTLNLSAGNYQYLITDSNNCTRDGYVTINQPDTLRAEALITHVNCFNEDNGMINLNITGGNPPYTQDFGSFNPLLLTAGSYFFSVTDINGCYFDSIAVVNEANEIIMDFNIQSPICRFDSTELLINIISPTTNLYTLTVIDSIQKSFVIDSTGILNPEERAIFLSPNFSRDIIISSIEDNNGCIVFTNDTIPIIINQLPELSLLLDDICVGESSFILDIATPSGGEYFINNINTNFFDVENLANGAYTIRYEYMDSITLCSNTIEKTVNISSSPIADFTFSPQPTDIENASINFEDNSTDIISSIWDLGDGMTVYDSLSFSYEYSDIGEFLITYIVTNQYNCTDTITDSLIINPIYTTFIPSSFTPNNDGNNDYFQPSIIGGNDYIMTIYNRWGDVIFETKNGVWDGTMKNSLVQEGVYSYSILSYDFKDKPFIYTGLVSLIK